MCRKCIQTHNDVWYSPGSLSPSFSFFLYPSLSLSVSTQFHRKRIERNIERKRKRRERSDENMFVVSKPISSSFLILSLDTFAGHWSVTIEFVCSWIYLPFSDSPFSLLLLFLSLFLLFLFFSLSLSLFSFSLDFKVSSNSNHRQKVTVTINSLSLLTSLSFSFFFFSIFPLYNPIFDFFMILIHYLQTLRRKSNPFHCFFNFTFSLNFFLFLSLPLSSRLFTHSLFECQFSWWRESFFFLLSLGCHVSSSCQLHSHSLSLSLSPSLLTFSGWHFFEREKKRKRERKRREK